jgi:hypothetical protein
MVKEYVKSKVRTWLRATVSTVKTVKEVKKVGKVAVSLLLTANRYSTLPLL